MKSMKRRCAIFLCVIMMLTAADPAVFASELQEGNNPAGQIGDIADTIKKLYTKGEMTEEAAMQKPSTLLIQLKDANAESFPVENTAQTISRIDDGLFAASYFDAKKAEKDMESLKTNPRIAFVEQDAFVHSEGEVFAESKEQRTEGIKGEEDAKEDILSTNNSEAENIETEHTETDLKQEKLKMAIIDSGIDKNNSYLKDYLNDSCINLSLSGENSDTQDDCGHGTAAASVILSVFQTNSIDAALELIPIKVLDKSGNGTVLSTYLGIKAAIALEADIINLSLSTKTNSKLLKSVIEEAVHAGILVVAAAGNDGAEAEDYAPGNVEKVLTTGAVNAEKSVCAYSNHGNQIDFVSYGKADVYVLNNQRQQMRGTSVAAAYLSGWSAAIWSADLNKTAEEIEVYLRDTAKDLGEPGKDAYYGYGMIGTIPENAEDDEADSAYVLETGDTGQQMAAADFRETWYPYRTGYFDLKIKEGRSFAKYRIFCSVGNRISGSNSYELSYSMNLIAGTDLGISAAPQEYATRYDNAPGYDPSVRQYHLPIRFRLNKTGYHFEAASVENCFQTYFEDMGDAFCDFVVDTNGCGMTNWGQDGAYHNDIIEVNYVPNRYIVSYNGNGATSGSMEETAMIYDSWSSLKPNAYSKQYTVCYNGNGGTSVKNRETKNCSFNGWLDYNDFTYQDMNYHWYSFSSPYYANAYPDLKNRYGYDKGGLLSHYYNYVINGTESREGSPVFSIIDYMKYGGADLAQAFGQSRIRYMSHWNSYGFAEGRKGKVKDTDASNTFPNHAKVRNLSSGHNQTVPLYADWVNPTVTLPDAARTAYRLLGWSTSQTAAAPAYKAGQTVTVAADTVFYAVWESSKGPAVVRIANMQNGTDGFCTYAYVQDGGDGIERVQFLIWSDKNGQDDAIADWTTAQEALGAAGTYIIDGAVYNYRYDTRAAAHNREYGLHNICVRAWDDFGRSAEKMSVFRYGFDIVYDAEGGNIAQDGEINGIMIDKRHIYETRYGTLPAPERRGYDFLGWFTERESGTQITADMLFAHAGTQRLYAHWKKLGFNIAYIGNEQDAGADFIEYGKLQSEDATLFTNQKSETEKYFQKEAVVTFEDSISGEEVKQKTTKTAAGWSFSKDNNQNTMYALGSVINGARLYEAALEAGNITADVPNRDYNAYPADVSANAENRPDNAMTDYVNLYAVWDCGAVIEAYDLYYTLEEAQSGAITEETLLSHAQAKDAEAVTEDNPKGILMQGTDTAAHTRFFVEDYQKEELCAFMHEGSITETYQARDSAGNITRRQITVHLSDTASGETEADGESIRFISGKYLDTLKPDSVWKKDAAFQSLLKQEIPQEIWSMTSIEIEEMKEFINLHGIGNSGEEQGLFRFRTKFNDCIV